MKNPRIPSYYILRVLSLPLLLFFLLTMPVLINLFTSNLLELIENGIIPIEIVNRIIEFQENDFQDEQVFERRIESALAEDNATVDNATEFFIYVQLAIFIVYILFNYPFRLYLRKKEKKKERN